jgi:hypothetical protein
MTALLGTLLVTVLVGQTFDDQPIYQLPAPPPVIVQPPPAWPDCDHFWTRAEILVWLLKDSPLHFPIVTTGSPTDFSPGAIGQPGTVALFGGNNVQYNVFPGGQLTIGGWVDPDHHVGLEASAFLLAQNTTEFSASSNGTPTLDIPAFRVELGREGAFTIAQPEGTAIPGATGAVDVRVTGQLWGAELNTLSCLYHDSCWNVNLILGFRYLSLRESLTMTGTINSPDLLLDVNFLDSFRTDNNLYAGQIGCSVGYHCGPLDLALTGKIAVGPNHEVVDIEGNSVVSSPGFLPPTPFPGGVLTQPTNIGRHTEDPITAAPQGEFRASIRLLPRLRASLAYDVLYWNEVVRPGDQIDRNINQTQQFGGALVGPARPLPLFTTSSFFAHGLNFGLELRF